MKEMGRFRFSVLLSSLVISGAAWSGPVPAVEPEPAPRARLQGLPGPSGTGLLPLTRDGAARTCGDLGRAVDRFLAEEVEPARQRVAWQHAAYRTESGPILVPSTAWGLGYVPGGPVVLAVQAPGGWDPGPLGAALLLGLTYFSEKGQAGLRSCQTFLDGRDEALRNFWESRRDRDDEPLPPELRDAVEQKMTEIRSYPPCRGQFRPPAQPAVPLRPPEGPP
jgi:hypothetical protein